jgi:two-component system KDP operon response regulator KdpE
VVDDEPQIRRVLRATLSKAEYKVVEARSGEEALEKLRAAAPDLILLDFNMPRLSGLETCRAIRATHDIPIIMLTVRDAESDKVDALDAGADDYVTKPFGTPELLARVRAALRRTPMSPSTISKIRLGKVEIDFGAREVVGGDGKTRLTPKEFDLLWCLVSHANRPVSHLDLLHEVWGAEYGGELEYLRVFVNHLRKKIEEDASNPVFILTEPRFGYRLALPGQE